MMQKTEAGMHVGLILLGVRVQSLEYTPMKSVKINGNEVFQLVNGVVQAAIRSSQTQDASDFEALVENLKDAAEGRPLKDHAGSRGGTGGDSIAGNKKTGQEEDASDAAATTE